MKLCNTITLLFTILVSPFGIYNIDAFEYTLAEGACINGSNLSYLTDQTPHSCALACNLNDECEAFEFFREQQGPQRSYQGHAMTDGCCYLKSSQDDENCVGSDYNVDTYMQVRESPTCNGDTLHEYGFPTVWATCLGENFEHWGVGPEGLEQAIANCNYSYNNGQRFRYDHYCPKDMNFVNLAELPDPLQPITVSPSVSPSVSPTVASASPTVVATEVSNTPPTAGPVGEEIELKFGGSKFVIYKQKKDNINDITPIATANSHMYQQWGRHAMGTVKFLLADDEQLIMRIPQSANDGYNFKCPIGGNGATGTRTILGPCTRDPMPIPSDCGFQETEDKCFGWDGARIFFYGFKVNGVNKPIGTWNDLHETGWELNLECPGAEEASLRTPVSCHRFGDPNGADGGSIQCRGNGGNGGIRIGGGRSGNRWTYSGEPTTMD